MSSTIGSSLRLSVFGQSHAPAIGCTLDGLPAGIAIDLDRLQTFLDRRAPGRGATATTRREGDRVRVLSGIADGRTCGAPFAALIENTNTRSADYAELRSKPRPGHADYPARIKYGNWHDVAGGGHFSGRLTAPISIAGGIALQALEALGIHVVAHIARIQTIADAPLDTLAFDETQQRAILGNDLPVIDAEAGRRMTERILSARDAGDSVGGIITCAAYGVPVGAGDPMFDGMENRIAQMVFGIPAVKGISFGAGFGVADLMGSQNNDPFRMDGDTVSVEKNDAGGILGGITTGAPITFHVAVKPTPSIARAQHTVDLDEACDAELSVRGRHDPCIVPRAVPVVEAACSLALLDALLDDGLYPTPAPRPRTRKAE